jgi:hypothetical protein
MILHLFERGEWGLSNELKVALIESQVDGINASQYILY